MDDNYSAVLASELVVGDFIIGADEAEYLIEKIDSDAGLYEYVLYGVNEAGQAVKASLARNAHINLVSNPPQLAEGVFGKRLCEPCGELRSRSREWTEDDYVCRVCRKALDSDNA